MQLIIDWGDPAVPPGQGILLSDQQSSYASPSTVYDLISWAHSLYEGDISALQHTYQEPGTYVVTVTLRWDRYDGDALETSQQFTITVGPTLHRALSTGTSVGDYAFDDTADSFVSMLAANGPDVTVTLDPL